MKTQIEKEKEAYKDAYQKLKELKHEIEHIRHLLEKSRVKMYADFEAWLTSMKQEAALKNGLTGGKGRKVYRDENEAYNNSPNTSFAKSSKGYSTATTASSNQYEDENNISQMTTQTSLSSTREDSKISDGNGPILTGMYAIVMVRSGSVFNYFILLGNPDADKDILAFYELKEQLMKKRNKVTQ